MLKATCAGQNAPVQHSTFLIQHSTLKGGTAEQLNALNNR
jgi:hypothetical protein